MSSLELSNLEGVLKEMAGAYKASGHIEKRAPIYARKFFQLGATKKELEAALEELTTEHEFFPEFEKIRQKIGRQRTHANVSDIVGRLKYEKHQCAVCNSSGFLFTKDENGYQYTQLHNCIFGRTIFKEMGYSSEYWQFAS